MVGVADESMAVALEQMRDEWNEGDRELAEVEVRLPLAAVRHARLRRCDTAVVVLGDARPCAPRAWHGASYGHMLAPSHQSAQY